MATRIHRTRSSSPWWGKWWRKGPMVHTAWEIYLATLRETRFLQPSLYLRWTHVKRYVGFLKFTVVNCSRTNLEGTYMQVEASTRRRTVLVVPDILALWEKPWLARMLVPVYLDLGFVCTSHRMEALVAEDLPLLWGHGVLGASQSTRTPHTCYGRVIHNNHNHKFDNKNEKPNAHTGQRRGQLIFSIVWPHSWEAHLHWSTAGAHGFNYDLPAKVYKFPFPSSALRIPSHSRFLTKWKEVDSLQRMP